MSQEPPTTGTPHTFGGPWTAEKLRILQGYLAAYTTALKKTPFSLGYIDAFAGTGSRVSTKAKAEADPDQSFLFPPDEAQDQSDLLDGSARMALATEPPFDGFIFIDKNPDHCKALESLRDEFPEKKDSISIRNGDANAEIQRICSQNWKGRRAVLFLDPYGGQVEWETIEAVASTKAIDLWLLFPLGTVVGRLLTKSGEIPDGWRRRLDLLLGTTDWYDEIYSAEPVQNLFGINQHEISKQSILSIGQRFNDRLRTIFAGVADNPRVLLNSRNSPLYLFCFAASNEKGAPIALKIAGSLLRKVEK